MSPAPQCGHNELGFNGPADRDEGDSYGDAAGMARTVGTVSHAAVPVSAGRIAVAKRLDDYVRVYAFRFASDTVSLAAMSARTARNVPAGTGMLGTKCARRRQRFE